jgi:hypothetical protein
LEARARLELAISQPCEPSGFCHLPHRANNSLMKEGAWPVNNKYAVRIKQILEATLQKQNSTFWANAQTGQVIDVSAEMGQFANHNEYLLQHPEVFGLAGHQLIVDAAEWTHHKMIGSQELRTLACQMGWVRIACRIDMGRRMDVEARNGRDMRKGILAMMAEYPELSPLEGVHYDLHNPLRYGRLNALDAVSFIETGKLPLQR